MDHPPHDEEEHEAVQQATQRVARRGKKKRRRMPVAGKSVFVLGTLLRARANGRRAAWQPRKKPRRSAP